MIVVLYDTVVRFGLRVCILLYLYGINFYIYDEIVQSTENSWKRRGRMRNSADCIMAFDVNNGDNNGATNETFTI